MPRSHRVDRHLTAVEILAIIAVIVAVVAMAIWFLFLSSGGIGQGTV